MKFLTAKDLMERWKVNYDYLAHLRSSGSRPRFVKISGIKYPIEEIEDIEKNHINLPTPRPRRKK